MIRIRIVLCSLKPYKGSDLMQAKRAYHKTRSLSSTTPREKLQNPHTFSQRLINNGYESRRDLYLDRLLLD